jgi:hypothetical protein
MLTLRYSLAATGVYLPQHEGSPPLALLIHTPAACATDAYWSAILMQLAQATPFATYSDCLSAIKRTHQAQNFLGPAVGHLQHGSLLLGIRHIAFTTRRPLFLSWTTSHPERTKPQSQWTKQDWGIHMADTIAGAGEVLGDGACNIDVFDCEDIFAALVPGGTWQ